MDDSIRHFKKGLCLGFLLSSVTIFALIKSRAGMKFMKELEEDASPLLMRLKYKILELKEQKRQKFNQLADEVVNDFSKTKEISQEVKNMLVQELKAKWHKLQAESKIDKPDEDNLY